MPKAILTIMCILAVVTSASAREQDVTDFKLSGVQLRRTHYLGMSAFELTMPRSAWQDPTEEKPIDRNFMAWLPVNFEDGVIEVYVASDVAKGAPDFARGFVGISFRIDDAGRFESIYLRPTNSIADDQIRRNHTVQYAAYPDFRFDRLRAESPEKYETYADIATGRWIHMKIEVRGEAATLYLDHNPKPAFLVRDLKFGSAQRGGVGIWVETGTVAHFRNLRVTPPR